MLGWSVLLIFLALLGLLRRRSRRAVPVHNGAVQAPTPPTKGRPLPADMEGHGFLAVVGESHYQIPLRAFLHRGRIHWAKLVPEPDNPFDRNAVMVEIDGHTVGYLSRIDANRYQRRLLLLADPIQVPAKLIGGENDKPSIGVLLDHRDVEALPGPKRTRQRKTETPPQDQPF